jgi:hypothetical protein
MFQASQRIARVVKVVRVFWNMFATSGQSPCSAKRYSRRKGWPNSAGTTQTHSSTGVHQSDSPASA